MGSCVAKIATSDMIMMYNSKSVAQAEMRYRKFEYDGRVKGRCGHAKRTFEKL
eukprot:g1833.t1